MVMDISYASSPSSPRRKKARQWKSKFKEMIIFFFDFLRTVHVDWVPEGQAINHVYYKEF